MHRLTELEHYVVGNIDDRADATDPASTQAFNHPNRGGRRRVDTFNHAAYIARTVLFCLEFDLEAALACRRYVSDLSVGCLEARRRQRRNLSCHPSYTQAITSIRREFNLHDRVVELKVVTDRLAQARIRTKRQDTLC